MTALALGRPAGRVVLGRTGDVLPGASARSASIPSTIVDREDRR